ncbi:hypothetical protein BCY89_27600 [Sphingobacterium siyangense]|uniref:HTH araC/xylS-type domain-containing protein n=1 Tax=Sphingobacterium siyangense TaxID=459529 RepID=A0A420FXJ6_9SPHI|nr:AraC family transcriptional regulator [Sphingobacterium siyangense]RKF37646.1 hypothetical protein BCY89_27600 [Sphingobacterium siyangense]
MKNQDFPIHSIEMFAKNLALKDVPIFLEINGPMDREILHKNDFCSILLVKNGSGTNIIDFIKYPLNYGQVHLVFPGVPNSLELFEDSVVQKILVNQNIFRIIVDKLRFIISLYQKYPVIKISDEGVDKLSNVFSGIKNEVIYLNPNKDILRSQFEIIAEIINTEIFKNLQNSECYGSPILLEFVHFIDIYYRDEKSPTFYASKLNITSNYLNTLCIRHLGQTSTEVIQDRVIVEAKKLLYMRDFSVKEISSVLGFNDPAYFSRFFKSMTGVTPGRYKIV